MPTNLHKKLFQSSGASEMLRPDIIPWDHYAAPKACSVVQSRQTFPSDLATGSTVEIEGLKYLPGQLMVFVNGVKLSPGIGYEEGEADGDGYCSEITLLIGVLEGDAIKFVSHNGIGVYYSELKYTVAPESATSLSYCPLDPSRLADGTSISIDWGDGTSETLEAGSSTSTPVHTYATNDKTAYQITLKATVETWAGVSAMFFGTSTTVSLNSEPEDNEPSTLEVDHSSSRVRYLVSVDTPIPIIGSTTRAYMFYNNRLLVGLPSDLFQNQAPDVTSFAYCFYYCLSLETVPSGLFDNCSSAKDFSYLFEGDSVLAEVPGDVFSACSAAENMEHAFNGCSKLESFEIDLTGSPNITSADNFANGTAGSASDHVLLLDCESVTAATFESASNANVWSECWASAEAEVGTSAEYYSFTAYGEDGNYVYGLDGPTPLDEGTVPGDDDEADSDPWSSKTLGTYDVGVTYYFTESTIIGESGEVVVGSTRSGGYGWATEDDWRESMVGTYTNSKGSVFSLTAGEQVSYERESATRYVYTYKLVVTRIA